MSVMAAVLVGAAVSGCTVSAAPRPQQQEDAPVNIGDVANAVVVVVPRVTEVTDPVRWKNGFGYGLELTIETDTSEAFSVDDLDAVVKTVWAEIPWEPNTITLFAGVEGTTEPVDLRVAAAGLADLNVTEAGQAGIGITGMSARYGTWLAPE